MAKRQRGRVSARQLAAAEVMNGAVTRRVREARLERLHRGVYGLPGTRELALATETAALLACGDGAVLSHHSAVTLWGLRAGVARPVHITLPTRSGPPRLDGVVVHRSRTLTPDDVRVRDGLPVTSPARAVLDAAGTLPDRDVERLLDEGLFALRILTLAEVAAVLARAGRHPGRARLERVAENHSRPTNTESPPEERLLRLIRAALLPEPLMQAHVLGYRLDFFWPELRLAVEVDTYRTHGSPSRFESDRRRDARLLADKGIVVIRVTGAAVEERALEVLALIARAIGQREAELAG
jgi:very-short-patch-repair endonuclease